MTTKNSPDSLKNYTSEQEFFIITYNTCFRRVVAYIYGYCKDIDIAKNIAQDSFITFWENIDKIDSSRSPIPYLFFIAKNKALNLIKQNLVRGKYANYVVRKDLEIRYNALKSSTLDQICFNEIEDRINSAMVVMKPKVRDAFRLSRFKGLKNKEIALELSISEKTVETRITSAITVLRKYLKDYLYIFTVSVLLSC